MSKLARNIVLADGPACMLTAQEWRAARERVAMLRSARDRRMFFALLNYLERGWEIIRPLHVVANRIVCGPGLAGATAEDVTTFIECDPIDVFRGITNICMRAIPDASQRPGPNFEIVADEAGDLARYLRILALGADHPEFPPELRELVRSTATKITAWNAGLADVLEPAENCVRAPPRTAIYAASACRVGTPR
ncbi:MAG TPA: hypothetical protein VF092_23115 [Longimicrobium sp.]